MSEFGKKQNKIGCLVIAVIVIIIIIANLSKTDSKRLTQSEKNYADSLRKIEYSKKNLLEYIVKSNRDGFDVTYMNNEGGMEQINVKSNSWSKSFKCDKGTPISIVAQTKNENTAIQVIIKYENKVIKQSQSNGDYVIATAAGFIGF